MYLGTGVGVVGSWAAFVAYATNQERLASSVVRQILSVVQNPSNLQVQSVLGDRVSPISTWYTLGPWINGSVSPRLGL